MEIVNSLVDGQKGCVIMSRNCLVWSEGIFGGSLLFAKDAIRKNIHFGPKQNLQSRQMRAVIDAKGGCTHYWSDYAALI